MCCTIHYSCSRTLTLSSLPVPCCSSVAIQNAVGVWNTELYLCAPTARFAWLAFFYFKGGLSCCASEIIPPRPAVLAPLPLPSRAAPFRSRTHFSFGHTPHIPFLSLPVAAVRSVKTQGCRLPQIELTGYPDCRLLLILQRPPLTPPEQKPEFSMIQTQWRAEGRLELELAPSWKWQLAIVDVGWRLDSLWSFWCSRRIFSELQRAFVSLISPNLHHLWLASLILYVLWSLRYPVLFSSVYLEQDCQWIIVFPVQYMWW